MRPCTHKDPGENRISVNLDVRRSSRSLMCMTREGFLSTVSTYASTSQSRVETVRKPVPVAASSWSKKAATTNSVWCGIPRFYTLAASIHQLHHAAQSLQNAAAVTVAAAECSGLETPNVKSQLQQSGSNAVSHLAGICISSLLWSFFKKFSHCARSSPVRGSCTHSHSAPGLANHVARARAQAARRRENIASRCASLLSSPSHELADLSSLAVPTRHSRRQQQTDRE